MTTGNINYNAVLADLEARKEELESAIATIKGIVASGGGGGNGSTGVIDPENIPVGSFLRLSIADATKKYLDMVKTKQSVPQIQKALERGGLPPVKYTTLYTVLRRRESQTGDVLRLGDEWALSEWYPNNPNLRKRPAVKIKVTKGKPKKTASKKTAKKGTLKIVKNPAKPTSKVQRAVSDSIKTKSSEPAEPTTLDIVEQILKGVGKALDIKLIADRLHAEFNKKINAGLLQNLLLRDAKKRFKTVGENALDLIDRGEK